MAETTKLIETMINKTLPSQHRGHLQLHRIQDLCSTSSCTVELVHGCVTRIKDVNAPTALRTS